MLQVSVVVFLLATANTVLGCSVWEHNLVTGPYGVSDDAITASSTYAHYTCSPNMARINSTSAWCVANNYSVNQFLQVKFRTVSSLTAITTLARGDVDQWVTKYKVSTSMDGITWTYVMNSTGNEMVLPGNFDRTTPVTNNLEGAIIAKYIRVHPIAAFTFRAMRLEVKGSFCPFVECDAWTATLGLVGEYLPVIYETHTSNQGLCGVRCRKQSECDSFLFDVTSARCRLLNSTPDRSRDNVNLEGVWYFVKT